MGTFLAISFHNTETRNEILQKLKENGTLTLTHSDSLWLTLTHSDSLWLTLTHSDSLWLTLTHSDSLWLTLTHSDSLWLTLTHSWLTHDLTWFNMTHDLHSLFHYSAGIMMYACGDLSIRFRPTLVLLPKHANFFLGVLEGVLKNSVWKKLLFNIHVQSVTNLLFQFDSMIWLDQNLNRKSCELLITVVIINILSFRIIKFYTALVLHVFEQMCTNYYT